MVLNYNSVVAARTAIELDSVSVTGFILREEGEGVSQGVDPGPRRAPTTTDMCTE